MPQSGDQRWNRPLIKRPGKGRVLFITLLAVTVAAADTVGRKPIRDFYNSHQRAFFLDRATVEFVRPGLTITVKSAAIANDGTITATFTRNRPLRSSTRYGGRHHAGDNFA